MKDDKQSAQQKEVFIGSELRSKVRGEIRSETSGVSSEAKKELRESLTKKASEESGSGLVSPPMQWDQWKDFRFQSHEDVHSTILEGEAVLLNLDNGMYYSLNQVGTVIWELCDGHRTLAEILEKVCERFEVDGDQARQDLLTISSQLIEQKLLIKVEI